jgi:hypothetical protein
MTDILHPAIEAAEIDIETFRLLVDIRFKALQIAVCAPSAGKTTASLFKKAEEIEQWLTRK